jgi:hypothetical protein
MATKKEHLLASILIMMMAQRKCLLAKQSYRIALSISKTIRLKSI